MPSNLQTTQTLLNQVAGFADDIKSFRDVVEDRLSEQSLRLDALDRKDLARPRLARAAETASPHRKAMRAYLRSGSEDGLHALGLEQKALSSAVNADGGYLIDPATSQTVSTALNGASSIRSIANVVTVEASAYDVLIDHSEMGAGWQVETGSASETATPQIDRISIALNELSAHPKVSQRLLDDSAFDLEAWLADRISDRFARAENAAFVMGDGVDEPTGFLTAPAVAEDSWSWGSLGYVPTGEAGGFPSSNPSDALIDLVYTLGARYRRNAVFVMNSTTAGVIRKFKDADGRYLWTETVIEGQPPRLFGYPVTIAEEMPDIGAGADAIAFGDFRAGYTIAERPDLRILRDPYSAKPHVLFYASKRVGGGVSDFAAIKLLRFAST
ncbi:MAG: phage major capsid protein [Pseudomonadota bacterium]